MSKRKRTPRGRTELVLSGPHIGSQSDSSYRIMRSQPDAIVRHDISDEELSALSDARVGYLWEGKWVAIGAALGVAPTAIQAFIDSFLAAKTQAMSIEGVIHIAIFVGALVAFVLLRKVLRDKGKAASEVVSEIRQRARSDVRNDRGGRVVRRSGARRVIAG